MTRSLDVLVVESGVRAADVAAAELQAAGHRVHRCHDEDHRGFPCRGLDGTAPCPVDTGVDVALLVRPRVTPRPTASEDGVRCALRAGVPLVEEGPEVLDPFTPWVARRVEPGGDVAAACVATADAAREPLRRRIEARIAPLAAAQGFDPGTVQTRFESTGTSLAVHLDMPVPVSRAASQALAVRVLDAVRSMGRTAGAVDVFVHGPG